MGLGQNCLAGKVIKNRDICKLALKVLGLEETNLYGNTMYERPSGCYWGAGNMGFFNTVVDLSLTKQIETRGGVCKATSMSCHIFEAFYHKSYIINLIVLQKTQL